jgi:hypothetical protein
MRWRREWPLDRTPTLQEVMDNLKIEYNLQDREETTRNLGVKPTGEETPIKTSVPKIKTSAVKMRNRTPERLNCLFCDGYHGSHNCKVLTVREKKKKLMTENRCFICLSKDHVAAECESNKTCRICDSGNHSSAICPHDQESNRSQSPGRKGRSRGRSPGRSNRNRRDSSHNSGSETDKSTDTVSLSSAMKAKKSGEKNKGPEEQSAVQFALTNMNRSSLKDHEMLTGILPIFTALVQTKDNAKVKKRHYRHSQHPYLGKNSSGRRLKHNRPRDKTGSLKILR